MTPLTGRTCTYCGTSNLPERRRCRACERPLVQSGGTSSYAGLRCLRCDTPLQFMGERALQEILLELHLCTGCGHVELLAPGVGEDRRTRTLPIPAKTAPTGDPSLPLPHEPRTDA